MIIDGKYPFEEIQRELEKVHRTDTLSLAVCVPSTSHVHAVFAVDLFALALRMGLERVKLPWVKKQRVFLFNKQGSLIHSQRQNLVLDAVTAGATHILFVDSDQTFPPDTVHQLACHDKLVVGANIVTKEIPARPCAYALDGSPCYTDPASSGLEEVAVCGTGLVLINTKIFGLIEPPIFLMPYDEEKRIYLGEDVYFCNKLRKAGVRVYVDHDLSKKVGHIGMLEYTHAFVGETDPAVTLERAETLRKIIYRPEAESV